MRATRFLGVFVLGAATLLASGCSGTDKAGACKNMKQEITAFGQKQNANPQQVGQAYSDLAKKFRDQSKDVGDEAVKTAASNAAKALDGLAADMRSLAAGNVKVPNTQALQSSFAELQKACGTS